VEQGRRYGIEISEDLEKTLLEFQEALPSLRAQLLASPTSGSRMASEYLDLIQKLTVDG
jgi:hypothetical protein